MAEGAAATGAYTLEQQLFHRLQVARLRTPSPKEFKEAWAF